jgi:hypothetical protein
MELFRISHAKLNIEEFINYIDNLLQTAGTTPVTALQDLTNELNGHHVALTAAYKKAMGSQKTLEVAEEDKGRDRAFLGIKKELEAKTYHFNPAFVRAAELLLKNINLYGSLLYKLSYQEQTTAMTNLIKDWETKTDLVNAVAALGLIDWLEEMKARNEGVRIAQSARQEERAAKDDTPMQAYRETVTATHDKFLKYVEANLLLNPTAQLQAFVSKYNVLAEEASKANNRRLNGGKGSSTDVKEKE